MKCILTLLLAIPLLTSYALSQEVLVDMPQSHGYIGVPMKLVVVYKDVESSEEPSLPEIEGFTIRRKPGTQTSSQTSFVNGKVTSTSTSTYTFYLTPQRIGTLEIPAVTFVADEKAFKTIPTLIEVTETPTSGALKVEVRGTSNDLYLGQPIDMTLRIFIERFTDPALDITLDARDMFSLLSTNSSFGMFTEALEDGRANVQTVRGTTEDGVPATFYVYSVQATTWPETTGDYHFDPISIIANYPISLSRQQRSGFFGGNSLTISQSHLISAQAEMPSVQVLTPPEQERPTWYAGAVGTFDFRIVAEPTRVNVGEPITLTMRVTDVSSGPVNLNYLSAPSLDRVPALTNNFKVPDKSLGGTTEGRTKTFLQTIRPRHAGITEIPSLPMSSFDPKTNSYKTVWTKAIPIKVNAVATVSASDLVGGKPQNNPPLTQQLTEVEGGILANYTGNKLLESHKTTFTPLLFASITFPPLTCGIIAFVLLSRRRTKTDASKQKSAMKNAMRSIQLISTTRNKTQVQKIATALRTIQNNYEAPTEIIALLERCDAVQFGGYVDDSLAEDANKLVEAMT